MNKAKRSRRIARATESPAALAGLLTKTRSTLPLSKTLEAKVSRVARHFRKSPRVVLKDAVGEYMSRHDAEAVTAAMNRVADAIDTRPEGALSAAAGRILEKTEW